MPKKKGNEKGTGEEKGEGATVEETYRKGEREGRGVTRKEKEEDTKKKKEERKGKKKATKENEGRWGRTREKIETGAGNRDKKGRRRRKGK